MPRGPKGEHRPTDTHSAAVEATRIALGEVKGNVSARESGKNPAAVALGRMGGKARAAGLSAKKRKEIARKAAKTRWANANPCG